ncbi:FAD-dependent oxidoreductase [Nocardioides sp. Arc9.136]|uniref:FAD-dependent oxidoreductase n=1 Tax=Nocardioides sp. Arc9.136 TaxID=2996826 RepID=UPI0026651ADA|nr:FAD-dependent oxidoreductase [Nocardioides sp. Arc9.136]WKN49712.1 FAD-dependent oxidoreductase [Nocardioides sp. Arc9.136]
MALVSPWQARHPRPDAGAPTLGGTHDVVVVGGGITGLTTAGLLARGGLSVAVVEARRIGAGTTGGSTAKVSLLQGTTFSRIARRHPPSVLASYAAGNREGQAWLARFVAEHGVEAQRRPAYTYATSLVGRRRLRAEQRALDGVDLGPGPEVEWVEDPPLPYDTFGALRLADQLQVDPVALLEALADDARAHGVRIVEGARVRRVTGHVPARVVTEHGTVSARSVVLATGVPVLDRGGFFARVEPSRSYGLAFRTPTPAVDGMYLSADSPTRSLRDAPVSPGSPAGPDGHLLLVGGAGHRVGAAVSERERLDELRAWTSEHWPGAEETHAWSAQDYGPHHGLPYAGPLLPGRDDLLVAGGYAKWGLTNGVAAAHLLAARVLGGRVPWAGAYATWDPRELRGLPRSTRLNTQVAVELGWGWLRPTLRSHPLVGTPGEGEGVVRYDRVGTPTAVSVVDGVERRVSAVCSHLRGVLRWNDAEQSWDCPLHGSRFAPDGAVLEGPATCPLAGR